MSGNKVYTHNYFGVGGMLQYSPFEKWVYSVNGLVGETFGANISVPTVPSIPGALGGSPLYKFGASVDCEFAKSLHANAGFDYTGFKYGASGPLNVAHEPDSTTAYTTVKIGIGYAF